MLLLLISLVALASPFNLDLLGGGDGVVVSDRADCSSDADLLIDIVVDVLPLSFRKTCTGEVVVGIVIDDDGIGLFLLLFIQFIVVLGLVVKECTTNDISRENNERTATWNKHIGAFIVVLLISIYFSVKDLYRIQEKSQDMNEIESRNVAASF